MKSNPAKPRVLFLCTHNSARSQLAEAIMRHIANGAVDVFSAGTTTSRVHPDAIKTLAEMGIDSSGLRSKDVSAFRGQSFDYVVTVCDNAREACPVFPGSPRKAHWSFPDPSAVSDPGERLRLFRRIAEELLILNKDLLKQIPALAEQNRANGHDA